MSPTVARPHTFRRMIATAALALVAATGITTGTAATASAVPAASVSATDGWATFTWGAPALAYDANGNGIPDAGDTVDMPFTLKSEQPYLTTYGEHATFTRVWITGSWYDVDITVPVPESGVPVNGTASVTVQASMLDALGGGPFVTGANFWYTATQDGTYPLYVPAPPVAYTAPTPITVSTSFDVTTPLVEGDHVHYVTHVTNINPATLTVTGTGFATPAGPQSLAGGASMDFYGAPVAVTYADMVAGGVSFADASVAWSVGSKSGTVAAPVGTAPTATINTSFESSVAYTVNTTGGVSVPLGDAVAGDVIDFKVDAANNGNVTMNYVGISLDGSWGLAADARSNDSGSFRPGTSLPNGIVKAKHLKSSGNGVFAPYALTPADVTRGYVDLTTSVEVAPSLAVFTANPAAYTHTTSERVFLKNFITKANLAFTKAQLNDTNGDGIGQEGETVTYRVRLKNNADQPLMIDASGETASSHVPAPLAGAFNGVMLNEGDVVAQRWDYTITAADVTRGKVVARAFTDYHGTSDSATDTRTDNAPKVITGVYVAPASTLDTAATYTDANADGFPSIGETVRVTVTVNNTGSYALTGLTVADVAGSDVTGLLPAFPASIAGGGSAVETLDYVLTAADFARGTLGYSTEMTATGLPTTASSTSVNLAGITFQAYATDLDAMAAGGISVCQADRTPTDTITLLSTIVVEPGDTCSYAGLAFGYRVVGFSTPLLMSTHSFTMTVPVALHVGAHRLAVYAPNGTLVGWKAVTAVDPIAFAGPDGVANGGATLAATGANGDEVVSLGGDAMLLVLLGTAFLIADSRRRKHAAR